MHPAAPWWISRRWVSWYGTCSNFSNHERLVVSCLCVTFKCRLLLDCTHLVIWLSWSLEIEARRLNRCDWVMNLWDDWGRRRIVMLCNRIDRTLIVYTCEGDRHRTTTKARSVRIKCSFADWSLTILRATIFSSTRWTLFKCSPLILLTIINRGMPVRLAISFILKEIHWLGLLFLCATGIDHVIV